VGRALLCTCLNRILDQIETGREVAAKAARKVTST